MHIVGAWLALALLARVAAQPTPPGPPQSQQRPWSFDGVTTKADAMRLAQQDDLLQRISLNPVGSLTTGGTDLDMEAQQQFQDWAARFGYSFPDPQKRAQAFNNWVSNMRLLYRTNVNGSVQFWAGENQFFHLSAQQYQDRSLMRNISQLLAPPARLPSPPGQHWHVLSERRQLSQQPQLPEEVDWLAADKVTAVKNQYTAGFDFSSAGCASCWAFTAVAAIESAYLIAHNRTVQDMPYLDLSEEQLLECCGNAAQAPQPNTCPLSAACQGGYTREGASYAFHNVLQMEQVYPYTSAPLITGSAGRCMTPQRPGRGLQLSSPPELMQVSSAYTSGNKDAIKKALTFGPVMANIDARPGERHSQAGHC